MTLLDTSAVPYRVVLTKADKPKGTALRTVIRATEARLQRHPAAAPDVAVSSARDGLGIVELRAHLHRLAAPNPLR